MKLDEFIAPRLKDIWMFPRNQYVEHPGWKSLYVRVSQRLVDHGMRTVIDLANIESDEPGRGAFRELVAHLRKTYPDFPIYVEQVLTPRFEEGLLVTFVGSHARYLIVACQECLAPEGLDCMDSHPRKNYDSLSRYPVKPHKVRRLAARSLRLERFA